MKSTIHELKNLITKKMSKNSIKTIAAIIVILVSVNTAFGKTKNMTTNQFELKYNNVDSCLIGTWERNITIQSKGATMFCQFNQNGTYIAFETKNGKYTIKGKGNWIVKNQEIVIIAGNEVSSITAFITTDNQLQFNNEVAYTKPASLFANR